MGRIVLPADMEVVVASFGGVGTTFLINFIGHYRRVNHFDDEDGIKHQVVPPISSNKNLKLVYVFGNPQLAVLSLFRRDYHHRQSKKLGKCVGSAPPPIPDALTLQEYVARGEDAFYFREHFFNWHDRYLSAYPTMFLRYETLFENVEPLLDFLELPRESLADFPQKKKRHSDLEQVDEKIRAGLDKMYGSFEAELLELKDCEIRQRPGAPFWNGPYLSGPYIRGYGRQLSFEGKELLRKVAPELYERLRNIKKGGGASF